MRATKLMLIASVAGAILVGGLWLISLFYSCFWNIFTLPAQGVQRRAIYADSVSGYFHGGTYFYPARVNLPIGLSVEPLDDRYPPGVRRSVEQYGFLGALVRIDHYEGSSTSFVVYYAVPFCIAAAVSACLAFVVRRGLSSPRANRPNKALQVTARGGGASLESCLDSAPVRT